MAPVRIGICARKPRCCPLIPPTPHSLPSMESGWWVVQELVQGEGGDGNGMVLGHRQGRGQLLRLMDLGLAAVALGHLLQGLTHGCCASGTGSRSRNPSRGPSSREWLALLPTVWLICDATARGDRLGHGG